MALSLDVRESEVLGGRAPEQIRFVSEFLKPYADRIGGRCAVIVRSDAHCGLVRMGSVSCVGAGVEPSVFRTREEAVAWLRSHPGTPGETDWGD